MAAVFTFYIPNGNNDLTMLPRYLSLKDFQKQNKVYDTFRRFWNLSFQVAFKQIKDNMKADINNEIILNITYPPSHVK